MSSNATTIEAKTVLVTGANRGLGRALVEEALRRGAKRVYAASRQPLVHADARVTPLILDVTDWAQIQRAVESVESLDVLINNAGISLPDDLSDRAAFEKHFEVNVYGPVMVTQALLSPLIRSRGRVVNVVFDRGVRGGAGPSRLFGVEGGSVLSHAVAARALGRAGRQGSRRPARSDRHRHGPGPSHSEDPSRVGRPRHLRRYRKRGGRDLPRPAGGDVCRELAHRSGQGVRTPERDARPGRAPGGMSDHGEGGRAQRPPSVT